MHPQRRRCGPSARDRNRDLHERGLADLRRWPYRRGSPHRRGGASGDHRLHTCRCRRSRRRRPAPPPGARSVERGLPEASTAETCPRSGASAADWRPWRAFGARSQGHDRLLGNDRAVVVKARIHREPAGTAPTQARAGCHAGTKHPTHVRSGGGARRMDAPPGRGSADTRPDAGVRSHRAHRPARMRFSSGRRDGHTTHSADCAVFPARRTVRRGSTCNSHGWVAHLSYTLHEKRRTAFTYRVYRGRPIPLPSTLTIPLPFLVVGTR